MGRVRFSIILVAVLALALATTTVAAGVVDDPPLGLLRDYPMRGGKIICWPAPPDYVDGKVPHDVRVLAASYGDRWLHPGPRGAPARLGSRQRAGVPAPQVQAGAGGKAFGEGLI